MNAADATSSLQGNTLARKCRFPAYPSYRHTDLAWPAAIPSDWQMQRLKRVARFGYGDALADENRLPGDVIVYGSNGAVGSHDHANTLGPCIVVGRKGSFGKVTYIEKPSFAIDTTYFIDRRLSKHHLRWLYYCLDCLSLDSFSKDSAVPGLSRDDAYSRFVPVCSPTEQQAIAAFLDRETAQIDALIAKKERLIELFQEKRTALISHAVTGGGPRAAAEVWVKTRVGRVIKLQRGFDITGAAEQEDGVPVISSGGFSGFAAHAMVRGPGVVVGRKGTLGTVHFVDQDYWPHDTTLWVREFRGNYPRFVYYFLIHMKLERFDVGAANPTLNRNHVHPVAISWPDAATQRRIAAFLDHETSNLERLRDRIHIVIDRLREYRAALISAAVTGKIDVRGEALG